MKGNRSVKRILLSAVLAVLLVCCVACRSSEVKETQTADPSLDAGNGVAEEMQGGTPAEQDDLLTDNLDAANVPDTGNGAATEDDIEASDDAGAAYDDGGAAWLNGNSANDFYAEEGYYEVTAKTDDRIEEPVGYLKDKVTETGVLGEDYPILSYYGQRSSVNGQVSSYHRGMDFGMETGTALVTPCDCVIKYTGYNETRGYWIVMYWGNGYYIIYQHLSQILVRQDMRLSRGNKVGYSGDTGASLVPHLHLEILQCDTGGDDITDFNDDSSRINPYYFVFGNEEAYSKPD